MMRAEIIAGAIFVLALVGAALVGAHLSEGLGWYIAQMLQ